MLYQQSLSGAFQMMADVFSSLTAAVGAADKVVELINRQPAVDAGGALKPGELAGKVEFSNVVFHYPGEIQTPVNVGLSVYEYVHVRAGAHRASSVLTHHSHIVHKLEHVFNPCFDDLDRRRAHRSLLTVDRSPDVHGVCCCCCMHSPAQHHGAEQPVISDPAGRGGCAGWALGRGQVLHCEAAATLLPAGQRPGAHRRP